MLFNDVIELVSVTHTRNDAGELVPHETKREVFANRKSVRQSEFYAAAQIGLRLEQMFEVLEADYDGETLVIYDGKRYEVERTYSRGHERLELICKRAIE